jgi:2-oxoacid dehydrogenases acyltransferase (catalytic domain)
VWADDGSMAVRSAVSATLSADHRATDGYIGARFLALVERLLHRPEELTLPVVDACGWVLTLLRPTTTRKAKKTVGRTEMKRVRNLW